MRIHLQSDFKQYYDHLFFPETGADKTWVRNQRGTLNRKDMFTYLMNCGFRVPINGQVKEIVPTIVKVVRAQCGLPDEPKIELATTLNEATIQQATKEQELETVVRLEQERQASELTRVVIYTDEYAHRGEGKILLPAAEALDKYPDHYCSQYIPTRPDGGSASERVITIGQTNFRVEYASSDWRSNCGKDAEIAITHQFEGTPAFLVHSPIFAIDYVRYGNEFLALDFNEAPDIDILKKYLRDTDVYDIIEEFLIGTSERVH